MSGKTNGALPTLHQENNSGKNDKGKKSVPDFASAIKVFSGEEIPTDGQPMNLDLFKNRRITKEKFIPHTDPVFEIGSSPVAKQKEITPFTAESKGGKTAVKHAFIACGLSKDGTIEDFPTIKAKPNTNNWALVDLDTEQSDEDQQYGVKTSLKMAGLEKTPEHYQAYNIKTLPFEEYKKFTTTLCELCQKQFGGIYAIFIDGGADYTLSIMDEGESTEAVRFFIWLADTFNCPVFVVIHLNENATKNGDDLPRGWIGRQAVRKGYAQLNITKQNDISTLQVLRARKAGVDTPLLSYQYSKEKGHHVEVDAEEIATAKQQAKDSAQFKKAETFAKKVFAPPAALLHKDAIAELMKVSKKSQSTAKRMLGDLELWGIVKRHEDGFYRFCV